MESVIQLFPNHHQEPRAFLVDTYVNRGISFTRGEGCYLIDTYGHRYLDLATNYGVNIFGYNHPYINHCLKEQMERLITLHCSFNHELRSQAAEKLVQFCGGGLSQVYFSNSGAEAIEAALKFAVLATGKKKFIACRGSYHGKTLGALSATFSPKYRHQFEPLLWEFNFIPYGDAQALEQAINEQVAAFLVEPIQGESGINLPSPGYLKKAAEICRKNGVLMIVDEIQSGLGRTGSFLASSNELETYDILCLGKGLAGGLPVGATLVSSAIAAKITKGIHTSTFGGNPLVCAGILATLNLITSSLLMRVKEMGNYFLRSLNQLTHGKIVEVRGSGLMIGIDLREKRDAFLKALQNRGIIALPAGEKVVRFLPPFIIERNQVDNALDIISQVVAHF